MRPRIPKSQVIKDMSSYDYTVASAAIDYYFSVYATQAERRDYLKRKHKQMLKDKIIGISLLGGFILLLVVAILGG